MEEVISMLEEGLFKATQEAKEKNGYQLSFDDKGVGRCQILRDQLVVFYLAHKELYPKDMYDDFLVHWSEPSVRGIPEWYRIKTGTGKFHVPRRLATWKKKTDQWNKNKYTPEKKEQPSQPVPDRLKMQVV